MSVWIVFGYLLLTAYVLLILVYWWGWMNIKSFSDAPDCAEAFSYSVLIPARNEATGIRSCIQSLREQQFDLSRMEIIVLNDHSTDETDAIVKACIDEFPEILLRLIRAEEAGFTGKKEAISKGVERATGKYIILTDADCTRGKDWLGSIDVFLKKSKSVFVYAPVCFTSNNFFGYAQTLEFAGLVGIGAAAIQLKNPNMCSAANLIFYREVFQEVGGYDNNTHLASGDDEFLLHKVFKKYPNRVHFLKDKRTVVYTSPNHSMNALAQQRRRWVSKSMKYEERWITGILMGAYFFNLSIVVNLLAGIFIPELLYAGLLQLVVKTSAEALLIGSVLQFIGRPLLILLLPLVQPFHLFYVLIIGIWANTQNYIWKERALK